jgi:hypothetical protein
MAFYTELPVYKDSYQLVLKVFEETKNFPREYKYTLGQEMKRDALHLLRCIYRANKHQNRVEHLEVFLDEMGLLELEIRLCVEVKLISLKRRVLLSELLERMGKQVTGWRNASR